MCFILRTLLGGPVSQHEVSLFALPARFGGLSIGDSVDTASLVFSSLCEGASVLANTILGAVDFC